VGEVEKISYRRSRPTSIGSVLTGCTNVTFPAPCRDCTMLDEKA